MNDKKMTEQEFIDKNYHGDYVYSSSEECWESDSIEEALEDEMQYFEVGAPKKGCIFRGVKTEVDFNNYFNVHNLIESLEEEAFYKIGSFSEEHFSQEIPQKEIDRLNDFVVKWANKNTFKKGFFLIDNIETIDFDF